MPEKDYHTFIKIAGFFPFYFMSNTGRFSIKIFWLRSKLTVIPMALLWSLLLSLTIGGCAEPSSRDLAANAESSPTSSSRTPVSQGEVNPQLVKANTQFGFKLFSQIYRQQPDQNLFISPTSVAIALSMTYNGAGGETQQAMARTLELTGLSLEEVNLANLALKSILESLDQNVELTIANGLWMPSQADLNPEFLQRTQQFYQAEVAELDFRDPSASEMVNSWVDRQTNGKIPQIVDRLSPETQLLLVNAIYFKGKWSQPFETALTQNLPFTLLDGSQKQQPLMSQTGEYRYLNNDIFQAVSLPYGEGNISFYVFLPKKEVGLSGFLDQLNADTWNSWMQEFSWQPGSIKLPRFQLEYEITLNDTLKALGMEIAFDGNRSDFSRIQTPPPNLAIDQVKHKTFVDVNEEGTEAAASTSVGIVATSVPPPPFEMSIDRPFFCAIRDEKTGTILFLGSIVDP
jgi:serine protease inhibitor